MLVPGRIFVYAEHMITQYRGHAELNLKCAINLQFRLRDGVAEGEVIHG